MSLRDILTNGPPTSPGHSRRGAAKHPSGWEPRVEETRESASVVTQPTSADPDEKQLLLDSDLDPAEWRIVGDIQVRRWQQTEDGPSFKDGFYAAFQFGVLFPLKGLKYLQVNGINEPGTEGAGSIRRALALRLILGIQF